MANSAWTRERRERQRELARRLHAEGRFGGAISRSPGRPKKRAPTAARLIKVLDAQVELDLNGWNKTWREEVEGFRALAKIAPGLSFDRDYLERLLVTAAHQLVHDGRIPELALLGDDGLEFLNPRDMFEKNKLRRELGKSGKLFVLADLTAGDARRFDDGSLVHALGLMSLLATRPLLRGALHDAVIDVARRALPRLLDELNERRALSSSEAHCPT